MSGHALPDWLEPLWTAQEMRDLDAWAIESGAITSLTLMERAGSGLAEVVAQHVPDGRIVTVCGKGNNGGDGLVAARLLRGAGHEVDVLLTCSADDLQGDAAETLRRLDGEPPRPFAVTEFLGAAGVIDAVLGSGAAGAPHGLVEQAIEAINDLGVTVISADIPSGVDATSAATPGVAIRATATATFHAAKPGLWIEPGKSHAGVVSDIAIGIPPGAPAPRTAGLIDANALIDAIPRRGSRSSKFSEGVVLVAGGSQGLTGAPCLAAEAAARAGAGYVSVCVPESLSTVFESRLLEAMTVALPDTDGALDPRGVEHVAGLTAKAGALVLGPGLGRSQTASLFARALASWTEAALVLDADGLNAHAGLLDQIAARDSPTVLTPHEAELARLLEVQREEVSADRLEHARRAARLADAIVLLKGDDTLVVTPDGRVAIARGGVPALATAGTGDVLSGTIAALLAKDMEPWRAACAGVALHARAGRIAARHQGGADGVIAGDVVAALPRARAGSDD